MDRFVGVFCFAAGILLGIIAPAMAEGPPAWYENFESPDPSWHVFKDGEQVPILHQERTRQDAHGGQTCESITLAGSAGANMYLAHAVGPGRIIDDLSPTVWVKSNQPGLQMAVEVAFPRTIDPKTGRPLRTILRGSSYTRVGQWQQLRVDKLPQLIARQLRVLRMQVGARTDGREAYMTQILLNVRGTQGATHVAIDDLAIAGFVTAPIGSDAAGGNGGLEKVPPPAELRRVQLAGSVLTVDGQPLFPRIVRYRGEPLRFLRKLEFNTIWLDRPATKELLLAAEDSGLWLICPPPIPKRSGSTPQPPVARATIGAEYGRVLAWDIGQGLRQEHLEWIRQRSQDVSAADARWARPIVCSPQADVRKYSRVVKLLLLDRRPLGTSLELIDYSRWLRQQAKLARPGTPLWTTIQTEPAEALSRQLTLIEPGNPDRPSLSLEQIRLLAYQAVACGSRGLLFESRSRLDGTDPQAQHRARVLELINLELRLIAPWAAAGNVATVVSANQPEVAGTLLAADRARLLIPIWFGQGSQYVPGQYATNNLSLVIPGLPAATEAHQLIPGGLRPLHDQRVAGGTRVTFEEFGLAAMALLSQDPTAITSLASRSAAIGPRAARLQRDLAAARIERVRRTLDRLAAAGQKLPATTTGDLAGWLTAARKSLQRSDGQLAARRYQEAYQHARRAMRSLRLVERATWESTVAGLPSPLSSPATVGFDTLPWHARLADRIRNSQWEPNRLAGGQFENLDAIRGVGWRHGQNRIDDVLTHVELSADAAHSGKTGVMLRAMPVDPNRPPVLIETPPVWITTPAVPVQAGQLLCIHGWVHIPEAVTGSVDGLMIVDSLTGQGMAERIGQTRGWQRFLFYRIAPSSGEMTVSFLLTGMGEVWLDEVAVQTLRPPGNQGVVRSPYRDRVYR